MNLNTEYRISVQRMACTACGAEANASCNCGKPYLPAKKRAAEAIAANPQKSNRAIAEEIGVGRRTVDRARDELGGPGGPPEREGRDGKVYRLPVKEQADPSPAEEATESFKTLVDLALRVKDLDLPSIRNMPGAKAAARRVVEAWSKTMEGL